MTAPAWAVQLSHSSEKGCLTARGRLERVGVEVSEGRGGGGAARGVRPRAWLGVEAHGWSRTSYCGQKKERVDKTCQRHLSQPHSWNRLLFQYRPAPSGRERGQPAQRLCPVRHQRSPPWADSSHEPRPRAGPSRDRQPRDTPLRPPSKSSQNKQPPRKKGRRAIHPSELVPSGLAQSAENSSSNGKRDGRYKRNC